MTSERLRIRLCLSLQGSSMYTSSTRVHVLKLMEAQCGTTRPLSASIPKNTQFSPRKYHILKLIKPRPPVNPNRGLNGVDHQMKGWVEKKPWPDYCKILLPNCLVFAYETKGEFDITLSVNYGLISCTTSNSQIYYQNTTGSLLLGFHRCK